MSDSIQTGSATLQVLVGACVIVTALFLVARSSGMFARTDPSVPVPFTNKEGQTMPAIETVSAPAALSAIPPIDLAAPAKTETATFALG